MRVPAGSSVDGESEEWSAYRSVRGSPYCRDSTQRRLAFAAPGAHDIPDQRSRTPPAMALVSAAGKIRRGVPECSEMGLNRCPTEQNGLGGKQI